MDLVLVQTQKQQLFSFLSVTWGLIADIDYESERMRVLGATRFTLYFIKRVLSKSKFINYVVDMKIFLDWHF